MWKETDIMLSASVEDYEERIMETLSFCGCGLPHKAIDYIGSSLAVLLLNRETCGDHNDFWNLSTSLINKNTGGNQGVEYFIWYVFDEKGFTEHGSAVPGWLQGKGIDLFILCLLWLKAKQVENSNETTLGEILEEHGDKLNWALVMDHLHSGELELLRIEEHSDAIALLG